MNKSIVSSFDVDHRTLATGLYLRSIYPINDDLAVYSWDLRFRAPMAHAPLGSGEVHTIEHLMAYYLRLDPVIGSRIVSFCPMGCKTGFYLSTMNDVEPQQIRAALAKVYADVFPLRSAEDIVGLNEVQCGNPGLYAIETTNSAMAEYLRCLYTREEAVEEATKMIHVYRKFAEEWMAVPVVVGHKSPNERFAGAEDTLTIEALMQDGKALQSGTSHFLGQNFAKAFDVQYVNKEGKLEYVWATSWGVSTRLMGALIMAHSDNNGLVLPPRLAPIQVVMVPIYKTAEQLSEIVARFEAIAAELRSKGVSVKIDDRDNVRPGFKFAEYELKGVPVRLAMGGRDMEQGTVELVRRDTLEKRTVPREGLADLVEGLMTEIQENIFRKALAYRESMITRVDTWEEFRRVLDEKGGFISAHWDGTVETEVAIKEATKATIRCIPIDAEEEEGKCIFTGKPSHRRVLFARSY